MKIHIKNIFHGNKKRKTILSLCLILSFIFLFTFLTSCNGSQEYFAEKTAKGFLKGFYEVENLVQLEEINGLWDKVPLEANPSESSIASLPEDITKKLTKATLKNVEDYITPYLGEDIIANRLVQRKLTTAKEYGYTLKIKDTNLTLDENSKGNKKFYKFTTTAILTFKNGEKKEQLLEGSLGIEKVKNKWLVFRITEYSRWLIHGVL